MNNESREFFRLSDGMTRSALTVAPQWEGIDHMALFRAEEVPREPLVFRHQLGGKPGDLIGTGFAGLYLLSDGVIQALREGGFLGWTTYAVEVYGRKGVRHQGYHGFAVTGRCGPIDWSKGRKERHPPVVPGGPEFDVWVGMFPDMTTWDGSDIFTPEGTLCTIVSEAVKKALENFGATNIRFRRLTECERTWPL